MQKQRATSDDASARQTASLFSFFFQSASLSFVQSTSFFSFQSRRVWASLPLSGGGRRQQTLTSSTARGPVPCGPVGARRHMGPCVAQRQLARCQSGKKKAAWPRRPRDRAREQKEKGKGTIERDEKRKRAGCWVAHLNTRRVTPSSRTRQPRAPVSFVMPWRPTRANCFSSWAKSREALPTRAWIVIRRARGRLWRDAPQEVKMVTDLDEETTIRVQSPSTARRHMRKRRRPIPLTRCQCAARTSSSATMTRTRTVSTPVAVTRAKTATTTVSKETMANPVSKLVDDNMELCMVASPVPRADMQPPTRARHRVLWERAPNTTRTTLARATRTRAVAPCRHRASGVSDARTAGATLAAASSPARARKRPPRANFSRRRWASCAQTRALDRRIETPPWAVSTSGPPLVSTERPIGAPSPPTWALAATHSRCARASTTAPIPWSLGVTMSLLSSASRGRPALCSSLRVCAVNWPPWRVARAMTACLPMSWTRTARPRHS